METQIIELEKKYWEGMRQHHYETVRNLTRFPCIVASKNGVQRVDEATFKKMFESGAGNNIEVIGLTDSETQMVGDSAVIAYVIELGVADDGNKSSSKCACTSTWFRENDKWLCGLHTEVELS